MDRRALLIAGLAAPVAAQTPPPAGKALPGPAPTETIDLWPAGAPGAPATLPSETVTERSTDPGRSDRAVAGIVRPRLVVFRPVQPNGGAMLVIPGGGFRHVVVDKEGYELGRWLAARGVTAFVLFYRLPGDGWAAGPDVALSDAQRAMRRIRHRAAAFGIDPARVGAMGFSAGGHVCADLAARFATSTYAPVDAADALPARPLLAAPIYPVVSMTPPLAHPGSRTLLIGDNPALEAAHSPHRNIPADAPPCFLVHAEDDASVPVDNSLVLRAALRARNIAVETHLFTAGGHGFGLRGAVGKPAAAWPELFLAWATTQGLVSAA
ncbi:alpha/beta hydrolase [Polymorphobacter fuscus]|uniref:Prolyl oligopeptidase family serine peptidase n=1 Tax=Sandarakinorhabdus fusca TaxID=1439888 RepID=A0A7C9GTL5_9SPHN|nr:alpha/beta hydrolase [Polymorphobacter fuscus]KAB7643628.1 alpha/beta hydrolase [Polymorphobacter fuscus]MQT18711.1 prolyl oligopeptidase family serine peptidase [Polymorphobacter fuscus]NJC09599.1 acetyl esterase/lipase [Polymorphobacter fuscus]